MRRERAQRVYATVDGQERHGARVSAVQGDVGTPGGRRGRGFGSTLRSTLGSTRTARAPDVARVDRGSTLGRCAVHEPGGFELRNLRAYQGGTAAHRDLSQYNDFARKAIEKREKEERERREREGG